MTSTSSVTVIGLGPMGAALARALLSAGVPTTVWNRSPAKAEALAASGAQVATTPDAAVMASDLVVVCLRDHRAARDVLGAVDPARFAGRSVVNLSSATPDQARHTAAWAAVRGIAYLSGAIMVPTPLIGSPEALILYSGDRDVFDRHADRLRLLACTADHLGADHGRAPAFDVAMFEIFFAGMTAFLHASAMVTAQGVDASAFLPYGQQIVSLLPETFAGLARDVDAGKYPGEEDNLAMELTALEHVVETSEELGLHGGLPVLMRDLARRAVDAGHGADGYSRVVELLRGGQA